MRCGRCGYNNYDESQYCKRCWAELYRSDDDNDSLSKYKNASNYQNTYNHSRNLYDGNNRYIKGLYNTDTNNSSANNYTNDNYSNGSYTNNTYTNNGYANNYSDDSYTNNTYTDNYTNYNEQYSAQDSTQYNNANTQYSDTDNSNEQYNPNSGNTQPVAGRIYNHYTEKSVPTGIYDAYRYNSCSNYYGADDEESRLRKRRIRNVRNSTTLVISLVILLFFGGSVIEAIMLTSGVFSKPSEIPVTEEVTEVVTQPILPEAELGGSMYSVRDTDVSNVKVSFHPPEGYYYIDNGVDSLAVFESEIYENTVSLTTMFSSVDIQEEIDYYESMGERNGTEVEISQLETNIGKMVEIGVINSGKGVGYQFYIEVAKDRYLYVSMTNIPFAYVEDAKTIIKLFMEDLEVSYLKEEATVAPTESVTE